MSRVIPALARVVHAEGSRLEARDLADMVAHESGLHELHVSAVHRAWGVAAGLLPVLEVDRRHVMVGPGVAYTARGRTLALPEGARVGAPAAPPVPPAVFDLFLRPPAKPEPCQPRLPACTGVGPTASRPAPMLVWVQAEGTPPMLRYGSGAHPGEDVPLGRFGRFADGSLTPPVLTHRHGARRHARPFVRTGTALPGDLEWEVDTDSFSARVDTADAGFATTPLYFASPRAAAAPPAEVLGPFTAVESADPRGFTVRLRYLARPERSAAELFMELEGVLAALSLGWVGVETLVGCEPTPLPSAPSGSGPLGSRGAGSIVNPSGPP